MPRRKPSKSAPKVPPSRRRMLVRPRLRVIPSAPRPFPIVGIGASAGGIEALAAVLEPIPADIQMAFVVVQHLAPHRESVLPGVLSASTNLPVTHATEDVPVEPGHVYVIPPDRFIELADGHLRLTKKPADRRRYDPIDHFFDSLAQFGQDRAIGVILSGNASDGSAGVRAINAAGGITIAQDPMSAKFDSMPRAAVGAGVDYVLPPAEIARELVRLASQGHVLRDDRVQPAEAVVDEEIDTVFDLLRRATGVDYASYRRPTVMRRIRRQMILRRASTLSEYAEILRHDKGEVLALGRSILIHVTRFFRDTDAFKALAEDHLPALLESRAPTEPIRAWVPGCSTGEEAYSIAIVLLEAVGRAPRQIPIQVFGTDLSDRAIDHARKGIYPELIVADVAPDRLKTFFTEVDGRYRIAQAVRDVCVFARQDITQDPPFSRLDVILCRNVLIYFDLPLQKRILSVFHYSLNPGGLLMLGTAETTGLYADGLDLVDKKFRIYRKRKGPRAVRPRFKADPTPSAAADADRALLERFSPPAILLDDELSLRQIRGQVGTFLAPTPGNASLGVFKILRQGLATALRSALQQARTSGRSASRKGLRVKTNSHYATVTIEVLPLKPSGEPLHYLVIFHEPETPQGPAGTRKSGKTAGHPSRETSKNVAELRTELEDTRTELRSMIQDLEAANEELQSANEEILSANEELQSTNEELDTAREELQSTNEEIITVNEELHGRNEDLARVNSDLINLLASVQIPIVMVDAQLRIRRFTPLAENLLNILSADVGRPIGHMKPNFDGPDLETLIAETLNAMSVRELQVRDRQGRWYLMRIRPYKTASNRFDGALLVFFDIDPEKLRALQEEGMASLLRLLTEPVVVLSVDFEIVHSNSAFAALADRRPEDIAGESFFEIPAAFFDNPDVRAFLEKVVASQQPALPFVTVLASSGDSRRFELRACLLPSADPRAPEIAITFEARP